jgi:hypothetical protein
VEVAVRLKLTKTSFAGWCLDHFGIATLENPYQFYNQNCTQTALVSPIYAISSLPSLLKPRTTGGNGGFCRPLPYHLATAPPNPEGIISQALALAFYSLRANS